MLSLISTDYFTIVNTVPDRLTQRVVPTGATAVQIIVTAGGGSGAGVQQALGFLFTAGSGGGSGTRDARWLTSIPTALLCYIVGSGAPQTASGLVNGTDGNPSLVQDGDGNLLVAAGGGAGGVSIPGVTGGAQQGAQGGGAALNATEYLACPGQQGGTAVILGGTSGGARVGIAGQGGQAPNGDAGGKGTVSAGPGHGPSGGAVAYNGLGPFYGALGFGGTVYFEWWG